MKKIFALLMIFISAILVGCGGSPQSKIEQYAQSVNNGSSENSDVDSDDEESTSSANQKTDVKGDLTIQCRSRRCHFDSDQNSEYFD